MLFNAKHKPGLGHTHFCEVSKLSIKPLMRIFLVGSFVITLVPGLMKPFITHCVLCLLRLNYLMLFSLLFKGKVLFLLNRPHQMVRCGPFLQLHSLPPNSEPCLCFELLLGDGRLRTAMHLINSF